MRHAVIVTAAGSSCRFNLNSDSCKKKEFMQVEGHSVLYKAVEPFTEIDGLCAVAVTYREGSEKETVEALENLPEKTGIPFFFVEGGETRQKSVYNALQFLFEKNKELRIDYVSIHDGARPFVTKELIGLTLASAVMNGACAPAVKETDTLVKKGENGLICGHLDRSTVYRIQTPQIFSFPEIFEAHFLALTKDRDYTDDTEIFNDYGKKVALIEGSKKNTKITYKEDLC